MTDLNQLRAACEHGKWERHATYVATDGSEKFIPWHVAAEITDGSVGECPGGRVLQQAIIIERENGDWSAWAVDTVMGMTFDQDWSILVPEGVNPLVWSEKILDALASAQENQP